MPTGAPKLLRKYYVEIRRKLYCEKPNEVLASGVIFAEDFWKAGDILYTRTWPNRLSYNWDGIYFDWVLVDDILSAE